MSKISFPYRPQEEDLIAEWETAVEKIVREVSALIDKPVPHFGASLISLGIRDLHREAITLRTFVLQAKERQYEQKGSE